jgi:hypothetical protein
MELMARWRVAIIGGKGLKFETFNVPIELQSRLFVAKSDESSDPCPGGA